MIGLGIILTAVYVPGWTGAAILSGWVVLSIILPFFFCQMRVKMGLGHWLGLVFLLYASLSMLWAPVWQQSVWDLWLLWVLAFCFCLGFQYYDPKLWVGMACGLMISNGFALAQYLGYHPIFANNFDVYAGTFVNPDMFGETACLLTIALIVSRIYWPLIFTLPPIWFTMTNSVFAAYAAVLAVALFDRFKWMAVLPALCGLLAVGWFVSADHAARPGHHYALEERFNIWRDTLDGLSITGRGPGSFYMLYPKYASRTDTMSTRPEDPHNEYLDLLFQYGVGAIPVFLLLGLGLFLKGPERYILVAFLTIAFFSFPTRIPTEGFIGMVALGRLFARGDLAWIIELVRRPREYARLRLAGGKNRSLEPLYPREARL